MSCQRYESMIALASGADPAGSDLGAPEAARLERHLEGCRSCRRFAAAMAASRRAVGTLASAPLDPEVLAGIRAGVLAEIERAGPLAAAPSRPVPRWLPLAAGLAVALGAAFLLHDARLPDARRESPPEPPGGVRESIAPPAETLAPGPVPPAAPVPETAAAARRPVEPTPRSMAPARPPAPARRTPAAASAPLPAPAAVPAAAAASEAVVLQWVAEDADVVIYWLISPPQEATKETNDEISAV